MLGKKEKRSWSLAEVPPRLSARTFPAAAGTSREGFPPHQGFGVLLPEQAELQRPCSDPEVTSPWCVTDNIPVCLFLWKSVLLWIAPVRF